MNMGTNIALIFIEVASRFEKLLHILFGRYSMGLVPTRKNLELCDKVNASAFCR